MGRSNPPPYERLPMSDINEIQVTTPETKPAKKKPGRKPAMKKAEPVAEPTIKDALALETVQVAPKTKKQLHEERLRKLWEEDSKMVRGIFRNHEIPGGNVMFPFRKYKFDPVKEYTLNDGEIYELPRMVASHINNNCSYPVHKHATDDKGRPVAIVGSRVQRYSFYPTEFADVGQDKPRIDIITPL